MDLLIENSIAFGVCLLWLALFYVMHIVFHLDVASMTAGCALLIAVRADLKAGTRYF